MRESAEWTSGSTEELSSLREELEKVQEAGAQPEYCKNRECPVRLEQVEQAG